MVWYLVQASQALQAVQAVQPMLHGESPPMMTPLQQVRLYKDKHWDFNFYQNLVIFASFPTHCSRTPPSCLQWTRPRLLQLSSTALFRSTLLYRLVFTARITLCHRSLLSSTSKNTMLQVSAWPAEPGDAPVYQVATTGGQVQLQYASPSSQHRFDSSTCVSIDSQLPSLISLFIFVSSISETAVVSLYMGGLIVCRPSAQPKLAADHVSLWISSPTWVNWHLK